MRSLLLIFYLLLSVSGQAGSIDKGAFSSAVEVGQGLKTLQLAAGAAENDDSLIVDKPADRGLPVLPGTPRLRPDSQALPRTSLLGPAIRGPPSQ